MVVVETSTLWRQRQQIYHRFMVSLMYIGTDRAELCKRHCLKQIFIYRALSFLFSSVQKFYFMSTFPSPCWDFFFPGLNLYGSCIGCQSVWVLIYICLYPATSISLCVEDTLSLETYSTSGLKIKKIIIIIFPYLFAIDPWGLTGVVRWTYANFKLSAPKSLFRLPSEVSILIKKLFIAGKKKVHFLQLSAMGYINEIPGEIICQVVVDQHK